MGLNWYNQPRNWKTGRWYTQNPRWWDMHLRLNTDERDALESLSDELKLCMTDVVVHGLRALQERIEADRKAVKGAAAAAPPSGGLAP